jgi:hypothetical protein
MNDNHNQAIDGEAKAKPEVIKLESISNWGLRGLLLNLRLLFGLHSRIPTNKGLQELVEHLRPHLQ